VRKNVNQTLCHILHLLLYAFPAAGEEGGVGRTVYRNINRQWKIHLTLRETTPLLGSYKDWEADNAGGRNKMITIGC
jgi:hypothetical protein